MLVAGFLFVALFFGNARAAEDPDAESVLYIYAREGVFPARMIERFEQRFGCRVDIECYDTHDIMLEKIIQPNSGFDVVVATSGVAEVLHNSGRLRELDHALLPNMKYVASRVLDLLPDKEHRYHVPYGLGCVCIAYNRSMVPEECRGSWDVFDCPNLPKKGAMLNDMRFVLGSGLKKLGYSINSTNPGEIAAAGELVRRWKRNIAYFSNNEAREALIDNELAFVQTFTASLSLYMNENPDIDFFIPEEGTAIVADFLVVPVDASEPELAHTFLNFLHEPVVAAEIMNRRWFYLPNPEGRKLVEPEILASMLFKVPYEVISKNESLIDIGDSITHYDEAWLNMLLDD